MNPLDGGFNERMCIQSGIALAACADELDKDILILLPNERDQLDLVQKGMDLFSANIPEDRSLSMCADNPASIIETGAK
jgi:hypothetical protein